MIGIDHIVTLRKAGYRPACGVIVWCSEHPLKRCVNGTPWADTTDTAEVIVGIDENPSRLDLRALHGLPVVVSGNYEAQRTKVAKAVFAAGAFGAVTDATTGAYLSSLEEAAHG